MQTMTNVPTFNLDISEPRTSLSANGLVKKLRQAIDKTDWTQGMRKIEKWTNRACLIIATASALYFAPIVINIFSR